MTIRLEEFTTTVDAGAGNLSTNNCEVNLRVNESQETDQNQQGFISTAGASFQGNISASGHIYQTKYPAFSATIDGTDSIDDTDSSGWQSITFAKENYDVGGDYDHEAAIPFFTAPVSGIYQFNLYVAIENYDDGMNAFGLRLNINNTTYHTRPGVIYDTDQVFEIDGSGAHHSFGFSHAVRLVAGDQVYPQHRSTDTTGNFDEAATINSGLTDLSWFDGFLVTPL